MWQGFRPWRAVLQKTGSAGGVDEEAAELQPPLGLSRLTAALRSLAEFLEVDEDLLAAAELAGPSDSRRDSEGDAVLDSWMAALPAEDKTRNLDCC